MKDYKRGSHTIWDCKYHLVWVTKYRYPVLGEVWKKYIEDQKPDEPDDDFRVLQSPKWATKSGFKPKLEATGL